MRVVQHCFGKPGEGGPATALARLQSVSESPYRELWQDRAANGISVPILHRFVRELRAAAPDLLHVRGLGNEGFHGVLAGRVAGVPKVLVSVHGTQRDLVGTGGVRREVVTRMLEPATLRMADSIVTVARSAARRSFLDAYRGKMLEPVPNGVSIPVRDPALRAATRARLGIAADSFVGLCVSRLTLQKGYADLANSLAAYEAVSEARLWDMIVVGDGSEETAIRRLFEGLERTNMHFVGQQDDVAPFYQASDLFLFPSLHENLSNALIEAMSFGLPVIATAVGDAPEILRDGGGILIPPRAPNLMLNALLEYQGSRELRIQAGAQARATVKNNYSLDIMEASWRERYAETIAR